MYSEHITIYIDTDEPVEVLASEVEQAFSIQLRPNANQKLDFVYADYQQWLVIHHQEADEGMADFPHWIEVGSYTARYSDRLKYARDFAQVIYDRLKATRRYRFLILAEPEWTLERGEPIYRKAG